MLTQNIYYQEERKYASDRFLALIVLTLLSFILSGQSSGSVAEKSVLTGFVLLALTLFSMVHYYFISTYPSALLSIRKNLLMFLDFAVLTFLIIRYGDVGIFLFPLYILIVMRSGLSFGISFFYLSLLFVGISFSALMAYSSYWKAHSDIIATFAITTFLIPFFYLRIFTRVHEENHELTQTLHEVSYDANYDELTGVANRKQYKDKMMKLLHNKTPFALLFIDLNKFKVINDTHGHHVGDEVLKEVARRLSENIDKDDFIARLGGDEFVIITTRKKIYMEKFIAKLERNVIGRHKVGSLIVPIELSIGISFYPEDNHGAMLLAKYADEAMYRAKKDEERYHYFYHEIRDQAEAKETEK
ncbi:diguanylate cyclase/phosphodiesterase (GGDEF & EAL domains) with PAS/PAC sensor(s) [hydrothermal vent metagenome]|uniref:Diguanylate cyclase/phosphodiesterase (GGDEF & EAL domains) with PAS/PAC sensor(S) n=1 Tax=hydrothermal vent metagenome TaxID=652676 RepID=A0A1W1E9P3_9ZZZZ